MSVPNRKENESTHRYSLQSCHGAPMAGFSSANQASGHRQYTGPRYIDGVKEVKRTAGVCGLPTD